ncbi:cell division protein FtsQ/DivIB [Bacillus sp. 2205SS5-2]|uniref:cell division protein FtsQ/DivIB n=1 Tax=Bacillus sp. 2205SS5-2 TaxID=3109031 RepID=UPI003006ED29
MEKGKIVSLEDRIPKLKQARKKKTSRRLTFLLTLFFLLIASVVYIQSPWSQVTDISVEGNKMVDAAFIRDESSIEIGSSVWKVNKKEVAKEIESLSEVKTAYVEFNLPNSFTIVVEEYKQEAVLLKDNVFKPVLESGQVLDVEYEMTVPMPVLRQFDKKEIINDIVRQLQQIPQDIKYRISEIIYSPKETDTYHITLYMNDGYEVSATIRTLAEKLVHYPSIVNQIDAGAQGVIDLEVGSFFQEYEQEAPQEDEGISNEE